QGGELGELLRDVRPGARTQTLGDRRGLAGDERLGQFAPARCDLARNDLARSPALGEGALQPKLEGVQAALPQIAQSSREPSLSIVQGHAAHPTPPPRREKKSS